MAPKYITDKKEYIYEKCKGCTFAGFQVAQGLHPNYGWWIQTCSQHHCKPIYNNQLELDLF